MRYLALLILCFFITKTFSQTITGTVTDSLEKIAFADVIIKDTNNKIITGTTTDDTGSFSISIKEGDYFVIVSFLGYENWSKQVTVKDTLNLGIITLKEDNETLDEIIIKSKKRVIERKVDRLVFNVEKSIAGATGSGLAVLKIAPRVQIQNGTIEIIGKGASRVLINGKLSPLEGEDLLDFLNSLSANDIKSIEVITNPPAKYEAAGNGGLLNIILKKGVQNSWKNITNISYNQNKHNFTSIRNNFYLNKNKVSFSASINGTKGSLDDLEELQVTYPDNFWNIQIDNEHKREEISGRVFIDYELTPKTTIGFQYMGSLQTPQYIPVTTSQIFNTDAQLEKTIVNSGIYNINDKKNSLNFHAITKLDSLGKNISFDVDYFSFSANKNRDFITENLTSDNIYDGLSSKGINISNQAIMNFSSKIDVELPLKKVNLSFGVKASFTDSKSEALFYNTITGISVLDTNISNDFMYSEDNLAAYISGNTNLSSKLTLKAGLRAENTKTKGENTTINEVNENNYTKLFPTVYLSYVKNDQHNFGFSYGRRINRPNFNNLNPFRTYISDNSYGVGNPFLQPSFTDGFEFSHAYKNKFYTDVFLNITNDGSGTIFTSDATLQNQVVTRDNYYNQYSYGISEGFSYNKISWWESQNSISFIGYKTTFTKDFNARLQNGIRFRATSNNTFVISKNTKLQVNSWYSSKHSTGLFSIGEMFDVSLGLQHSFKNNFKVSLLANDILNTASLNNYTSIVNDIKQVYAQNRSSRNFLIGISYEFGNKKINVKNRAFGNDDELNRSN